MSKAIGFIPLRKGSKGLPGKNRRKLLGRPLFSWVLTEAIFSDLDRVYVFTDDQEIIDFVEKNYQWTSKVSCVKRSAENASDTASTEDAILEFCDKLTPDFEIFCLLQATSPLTSREDIDAALKKMNSESLDAVLSVVRTHRFTWSENGRSLNYDYKNRPRRQDFEGLLIENGAVYCTSKSALLSSKNRLSGRIGTVEMPEDTLIEIDTETDWQLAEQLIITRLKKEKALNRINHLVLDVDGVFTDGGVAYSKDGELSKTFDIRDGMGLEIIREHGVNVVVLTSENSEVVASRMKKLKIKDVFLGVKDKFAFLEDFCARREVQLGEIAYIGDDVNDLANLLRAGWSLCPANATKTIKYHADLVLQSDSARGAIREATEFIINYNLRFNDL